MLIKSIIAGATLIIVMPAAVAYAQLASDEQEFREMGAALKASDAERKSTIATCIKQGIGDNPTGAAKVMGVPVEKATRAWCTRMTIAIAEGKLTLADVRALNEGKVTPGAAMVLTTAQEGE